jgi:hypothetical protein
MGIHITDKYTPQYMMAAAVENSQVINVDERRKGMFA